jgi:hypothetical protein
VVFALFAVLVYATTETKSPKSCSGTWSSCNLAYYNDGAYAQANVTNVTNKTSMWMNYTWSNMTNTSNITNVTVILDAYHSHVGPGGPFLEVSVSWNNGLTYGPVHLVGVGDSASFYDVDVTGDTTWTPVKLLPANFKVKVTCLTTTSPGNCYLDWLPVEVTFT